MKYMEFGQGNPETILLLHGGGLSWWSYQAEAELLQSEYRIVLPILDGHAGSDRPFTSIESNAAELVSFTDEALGGRVLLMGGLSLGAQILLEALSQRGDICRFAVAESPCVVPSKLTNLLIGPAVGSCCALIRSKSFAKLQFRSLHMDERFFDAYYRDTCQIARSDMTAFLKANTSYSLKASAADTAARVHVVAGEKETRAVLRSAELIKERVPGCRKHILPGLFHGEFSINHPERYAEFLKEVLAGGPF